MSTTVHQTSLPKSSVRRTNTTTASEERFSPFVDLQYDPFRDQSGLTPAKNPVQDLIPDEVYDLLRANDMLNEKAIRDHVIRKAFRELREEHHCKTTEAMERIKEIYPYLQLDTIRKIIYRIHPTSRKVMM